MPEGHLIHRHAGEQHAALSGRVVRATSPQGRFDARPYDGRAVTEVEAVGKHLLYHVDGAPTIHVHLGMRGLFLRHADPATAPRGGTRLRLATDEVAYDLIAPIRCEPLDPQALAGLRASLGPDPLRRDAEPAEAVERLTSFRGPVGAAVLDQGVWAGIGNAWRAELLFLTGLHPGERGIGPDAAARLWETATAYMPLGRDAGQVVSDPDAPGERWVYKRDRCRRCGAGVRTWQLASRTAYACPQDQPG
ncbi:formamidopyrimidine-DNA glycolase [Nonomuraea mesophila]|uniref:DNA-(apurinic or apyrimidinic site) lyase n=1 Tax=Nonomuraea mesophila TaxID=2530382 RepID=A0A4R5FU01_9ACTN|nr:DNA glycosylase [Nonomuraea mesophila]TDE57398.1 formamidopyrimidine-DNA glycolase [Nonomuraea mesophila]